MKLTSKQVEKIYKDWKGKDLNLDEMKKIYCFDPSKYVLFKCHIEFRRGSDYNEEGLLTLHEFKYVEYMFNNGFKVHLGEINGKHSEVTVDDMVYTFYDGSDGDAETNNTIEEYITQHGTNTNVNHFSESMREEDCKDCCKYDKKCDDDEDHTHAYCKNKSYDEIESESDESDNE